MIRKLLMLLAFFVGITTVTSQEYIEMIEAGTFTVQEIIDNGEAYFDFDAFDPYYVNFDENITKEQLQELTEKNEQ